MTYQLSSIVSKVQQRVRDTGYPSSEIKDYINDTQNDVFNEYRLRFMRSSADFTVSVGNSDLGANTALPTDYVEAITLTDTTNGQERVIPFIDMDDLFRLYPDTTDTTLNTNGQPQYAYDDGSTIRLFPAPADAYTFRLNYYKRPTTLSADGDVPAIPSEFEELLIAGGAYRVLQVKGAYDEAGIFENKYAELLQKLVDKYSRAPAQGFHSMLRGRRYSRQIDSYNRIP